MRILLIVAALTQNELVAFSRRAHDLGLDVLCEAHDKEELMRAADAGCELIGINNRDLRTFHVDIETAVRLSEFMPKNAVVRGGKWHPSRSRHRLGCAPPAIKAFLIPANR